MRLWNLHPCYLDARGLTALWREGLLARKVLLGQTRGYRSHPQLERFKILQDPVGFIDSYLLAVFEEASRRGYHFDKNKIGPGFSRTKMPVTSGQLRYELRHLQQKLKLRDAGSYNAIAGLDLPAPHPSFEVIEGGIAAWERVPQDHP